jgi:hypothetical protein
MRHIKYPPPATGTVYGRWKVLAVQVGRLGGVKSLRVCCTCGHEQEMGADNAANVLSGRSKQCTSCGVSAMHRAPKDIYGYKAIMPESAHRRRWLCRISQAVRRCHNPAHSRYADYGGRGVRVCQAWRSNYGEFLRYIRSVPGWDVAHLTLDRIDNSQGYQPGNVRCVSRAAQNRNQRSNNFVEYQGVRLCLADFWRRYCPAYRSVETLRKKLCRGASVEKLLSDYAKWCADEIR